MREFKVNGKKVIVYTSCELRKVIGVKKDTWKTYCDKGFIPETPIYMDYQTNLPVRENGVPQEERLVGRRRFYTEKMVLVFKAWFDAVRRGKLQKQVNPTEDDLELLKIEFNKAVLEFKQYLTVKELEGERVLRDLFLKLFRSIDDSIFTDKNSFKEVLYTEFLKAVEEFFK